MIPFCSLLNLSRNHEDRDGRNASGMHVFVCLCLAHQGRGLADIVQSHPHVASVLAIKCGAQNQFKAQVLELVLVALAFVSSRSARLCLRSCY